VVTTVQPLVEKKSNRLEVRLSPEVGAVHADVTKVRQVLFNLLSNACKFTENGTVTLSVGRQRGERKEWLLASVADTGIGMTAEQLAKLFQAFSQADASTTRKYGGTGLGLAISRKFCQMMGGDILVESEFGKGTTFTMKIPTRVRDPRAMPSEPEPGSADLAAGESEGHILVIDDDLVVHELMRRFLTKEGYRVTVAGSGEEGLRLAAELGPDAITLDVQMPGLDGWSVLTALKADPRLADIPVIMLTMVDEKNLGYALGAYEYLTKPVDRDRLASILRKLGPRAESGQVLVVEDDGATRQMVCRMLEKEGWVTVEAENGRVALERIAARPPSLVLLDLMMPEMDGFAFISELRRHEEWRSIPVVVITAKDITAEDRLRLDGFVQKVLHKGATSRDDILREVRDLVSACVRGVVVTRS
jgi:hypothetical protein